MAASANASGVRVIGDGSGRATAAGTRLESA